MIVGSVPEVLEAEFILLGYHPRVYSGLNYLSIGKISYNYYFSHDGSQIIFARTGSVAFREWRFDLADSTFFQKIIDIIGPPF